MFDGVFGNFSLHIENVPCYVGLYQCLNVDMIWVPFLNRHLSLMMFVECARFHILILYCALHLLE